MKRLSDSDKKLIQYLQGKGTEVYQLLDIEPYYLEKTDVLEYLVSVQIHLKLFQRIAVDLGFSCDKYLGIELEKDYGMSDMMEALEEVGWNFFKCLRLLGWDIDEEGILEFYSDCFDLEEISFESIAAGFESDTDTMEKHFSDRFVGQYKEIYSESGSTSESFTECIMETVCFCTLTHERLGSLLQSEVIPSQEKAALKLLAEEVTNINPVANLMPYISGIEKGGAFSTKLVKGEYEGYDNWVEECSEYDWSCIWSAVLLEDEIERLEEQYGKKLLAS